MLEANEIIKKVTFFLDFSKIAVYLQRPNQMRHEMNSREQAAFFMPTHIESLEPTGSEGLP